ncbi:hypothetical protein [Puniceicoccus vermicola]|uniref:Uncharacterized protein n=1 Tax=Puniceicoccus vermicola TaxID=388746 RepID=A0A7X1E4L2_9BACT|nr:hypothetical protein [Puniceicoccus vermicola]MBC2602660.1 hypothetical protein [Puniceicoccus vermicola]
MIFRRQRRECDSGFALVVALSLMAFVLLLLLSLSSLISVERKSVAITTNELQARSTALLAMQNALGELQKHAGRDQRVSAGASILDTDPETMAVEWGGEEFEEEYWTGIWDENGQLKTWLVSGNEGLSPADADFVSPVDEVVNGASFYDDDSVQAPLVLIEQGAYAFWVGDEGVKAKLPLLQGATASTSPLASAQKVEVSLMTDLDWLDGSSVSPGELEKVVTTETMKLLGSTPDQVASLDAHRHDLSHYGYGLLTDPVEGGLKKDLTLALFDGSDLPSGQIFEPVGGGAPSLTDPGGPLWGQLQSWAQAGSSAVNSDGSANVRPATDVQTGIFPVVTQMQFYVAPRYVKDTDAQTLRVYLEIYPAITLWNPYDRPLTGNDFKIDIGRNFWDYSKASPEYNHYNSTFYAWKLTLWDSTGASEEYNHQSTQKFPSAGAVYGAMHFDLGSVRLNPGESMVFSAPAGNGSMDIQTTGYSYYPLAPGFRPTAYYSLETDVERPYDPADPDSEDYEFVLAAWRTITLSLRLRNGDDILQQVFWLGGVQEATPARTALLELGSTDILVNPKGVVGVKSVRNFTDSLGNAGEDESIQWLAHQNPRGGSQGLIPIFLYNETPLNIQTSHILNPSFYASSYLNGYEYDFGLTNIGNGLSVDSATIDETVLFETPPGRDRLHGVGQLMHAPLYYSGADVSRADAANSENKNDTANRLRWWRFDNSMPAYAVGNSEADPRIPLDALFVDWNSGLYDTAWTTTYAMVEGRHYDHSYLLNRSLWDGYFFSALPNVTSRTSGNSRVVALDETRTSVMTGDEAAAEFMIDGAFNINSTSEEAWRAVLGAFFGVEVESSATDASPFLRVHDNPGDLFDAANDDSEDEPAYHGYRALTEEQIANLARQIVKQVKWRALGRDRPFTSMADFVNRDPTAAAPSGLGDADAFRLRGALSSAIAAADQISTVDAGELGIAPADAVINEALSESAYEATPRNEPAFTQEAQEGWRTESLPGWLTQGDLLARLGPVLNVRSDTFTIRAYGETRDPITDTPTSKAWCEATVQRVPEFVDVDADSPETPLASLNGPANAEFGRRFVLVDFRWLAEL